MRSVVIRSAFDVAFKSIDLVIIIDKDIGSSVTNDVDNVVAYLHDNTHLGRTTRLAYRDTTGRYDYIGHDGKGNFTTFISAPEEEQAILARLATSKEAPTVDLLPIRIAPHLYSELLNSLYDTALEYKDTQQLRAKLSKTLSKFVAPNHQIN